MTGNAQHHNIECTEIWGGIRGEDVEVSASGFVASLYSRAADGPEGGDVYYLSSCCPDAVTRVALADVRGHGEAVSDISQWLYSALQDRVNQHQSNRLFTDLNILAKERGYEAMTSAAIATFIQGEGSFHFSYAGHPPMYLYSHAEKQWEAVNLGSPRRCANLPLGAFSNSAYDQETRAIEPGDRLFLYTDGLIEATDREGQPFGRARLRAALEAAGAATVRGIKAAVLSAVRVHTRGLLVHDDVTFMVIEPR